MSVYEHDNSSMDSASVTPTPEPNQKMQNLTIYISVNSLMVLLQLLGGWGEYTFFGNIFFGLSIILLFVSIAVVSTTDNKIFAKTHILGWWNLLPLLQGFVSLGFGWWTCWIVWWSIFVMMMTKKLIADAAVAKTVVESGAGSVPVSPIMTDPAADEIRETWNGWRS